ncbi:MAG TPA: hypothetical protein VND64_28980, partial [Pirellulales bacterium]|nr:hypothetical protein [Pirellulales bacterium]
GLFGILSVASEAPGEAPADVTAPRRATTSNHARGRVAGKAPADETIPLRRSRPRTATFYMSGPVGMGGVTAYDIKINAYQWRKAKSSTGVIDGNAVVGIGRVNWNGLPMLANVYRAPNRHVIVYGPPSTHGVAHTTHSHRDYNPTPHYSVGNTYIADDRTNYWGLLQGGSRVNVSNLRKVDPSAIHQRSRHANRPW